jgi:hypothetical protein
MGLGGFAFTNLVNKERVGLRPSREEYRYANDTFVSARAREQIKAIIEGTGKFVPSRGCRLVDPERSKPGS